MKNGKRYEKIMKISLLISSIEAFYFPICQKLKPIDQFCNSDIECETGFCMGTRCSSRPKVGFYCGPDFQCAPGLGCSAARVCEPIAKIGEPCQLKDTGLHACDDGLLCYNGICQETGGLYSLCSDNNECAPNLRCGLVMHTGEQICISALENGKSCSKSDDCLAGSFCDIGGTYGCSEYLKENQVCAGLGCEEGLDCLPNRSLLGVFFVPLKCQKLPTLGNLCYGQCAPGHFCA
jgi:hypothetical protein